MIPYSYDMINNFLEEKVQTTATPAADYLFEVKKPIESTKLLQEQSIEFHHNIAKLLFLSTPDGTSKHQWHFFIARVKEQDDDDWGS